MYIFIIGGCLGLFLVTKYISDKWARWNLVGDNGMTIFIIKEMEEDI
jgi:hypothetical protein